MKPAKRKPGRREKFRQSREEAARKQESIPAKMSLKWPLLLIAICSFALYANTLGHDFVLDDYSVILENRLTKQGVSAIPEIFTTSYRYGYFTSADELYRPLPKAMFATEWALSPGDAFPGHLVNILLYMITGISLFFFLMALSDGKLQLSLIITLLFVFHPVHTEVVANIKSRDELLAAFFGILSLNMYVKYLRSERTSEVLLSALFFFLGFLSKESTITLLAVFPCLSWLQSDDNTPFKWKGLIPLTITAMVYLLIRAAVLEDQDPGSVSVADNLLSAADSVTERFSTAILLLGLYLQKLIVPHPLIFDHSYNHIQISGPGNWKVMISGSIYMGLLLYGARALIRKELLGFGMIFYLITMSIYSNLFITIGSSFAERFLFMPSVGFCIALGILINKGVSELASKHTVKDQQKRSYFILTRPGGVVFIVILILFSIKTISRNPVWKNNMTLYSNDIKLAPNSTRTQYYLGNLLVKPKSWGSGDSLTKDSILNDAIKYLNRSIEIYPQFADAHVQKGIAYYHKKDLGKALESYNKAYELNPNDPVVNNNIGTVLFESGQYGESLEYFLRAVEFNNAYAEAYMNAGSAYGVLQNYEMAINYFNLCLRYDPGYAQAYYFLGITYQNMGNEPLAKYNFDKAEALGM
jgi:Flp pilus assembly protein TadD